VYNSCIVISYHPDDVFQNPEAVTRKNYYGIPGFPSVYFDGIMSLVGGTNYPGTIYPQYRDIFETRVAISSPLEITLDCSYDSVANSGNIDATILNTTGSPVSGNLHFVLIEDDKPYNWGGGLTEVHFVMRDMLPDASGESVSIPASDTIMRSRPFTVDGSWDEYNCRIVVFVQASNKEIYQGAEIGIIPQPEMVYFGALPIETSGNGNGFGEPGESMELKISGKNMGTGTYDGTVLVQCTDPNISITSATPASVSMEPGDIDTVITVQFDIDAGCPDPHQTAFEIDFGSPIDSIPFVITTTAGFADDMESGEGDWTKFGPRNYWHITEYDHHSGSSSWHCGYEATHMYGPNNDASLATPYFVALPDSPVYFWHRYSLESNWDFGYIDIDNGSDYWETIDRFSGFMTIWDQTSYPLDGYDGQTIRIRFRFLSDGSTHFEGWYVDDVWMGSPPLGVEDISNYSSKILDLDVYPNPFKNKTEINYNIGHSAERIELKIFDASGRLIRSIPINQSTNSQINQVSWFGDDALGRKLPAGIYFIELNNNNEVVIEKIILTR
jgi:hypothetical protein